jgi:hypothetical protein
MCIWNDKLQLSGLVVVALHAGRLLQTVARSQAAA